MKKFTYIIAFFIGLISVYAQESPLKLSLAEAVDYAIKNNYDNKVASKNIDAAKERKWETTTIGLPQINGAVSYQNWLKQQVSLLPGEIAGGAPGTFVPVTFGTQQTMNATVTLSQLLFDGSYLVGLQSAKTYLKISEQAKEKTELSTREAVINAYGNVLVSKKSIEILEKNKRVLEKNLSETQKIYENGLTELENVEQLQITLGTLDNNLRNAKRLNTIAEKMLNVALGNKVNRKLELTDTLEGLSLQNTDLSVLTKKFDLENHIDFKIAENDRESKRLLMQLERSKALPTLSAFVNYGASANSNEFTFFNGNQEWFKSSLFGVNLNIPIFSSFGRRSKTRRAKIELENADIRLEEARQKLNLRAENARSEYQLSIENLATAKKNLELSERIEKKQQVKFFEGISTSFELSQAQNQLYTQQNNYIQAMVNVIAKKAALDSAFNTPIK